MSFQSRDFRHFIKAGVTVCIDVRNGKARVTTSFLNPYEKNYSRPAARTYAELQFSADDSTLRSMGIKRNVLTFAYSGSMPRRDILHKINDALAPALERRIKSHRHHYSTREMRATVRKVINDLRTMEGAYGEQPKVFPRDGMTPNTTMRKSGVKVRHPGYQITNPD